MSCFWNVQVADARNLDTEFRTPYPAEVPEDSAMLEASILDGGSADEEAVEDAGQNLINETLVHELTQRLVKLDEVQCPLNIRDKIHRNNSLELVVLNPPNMVAPYRDQLVNWYMVALLWK